MYICIYLDKDIDIDIPAPFSLSNPSFSLSWLYVHFCLRVVTCLGIIYLAPLLKNFSPNSLVPREACSLALSLILERLHFRLSFGTVGEHPSFREAPLVTRDTGRSADGHPDPPSRTPGCVTHSFSHELSTPKIDHVDSGESIPGRERHARRQKNLAVSFMTIAVLPSKHLALLRHAASIAERIA